MLLQARSSSIQVSEPHTDIIMLATSVRDLARSQAKDPGTAFTTRSQSISPASKSSNLHSLWKDQRLRLGDEGYCSV